MEIISILRNHEHSINNITIIKDGQEVSKGYDFSYLYGRYVYNDIDLSDRLFIYDCFGYVSLGRMYFIENPTNDICSSCIFNIEYYNYSECTRVMCHKGFRKVIRRESLTLSLFMCSYMRTNGSKVILIKDRYVKSPNTRSEPSHKPHSP